MIVIQWILLALILGSGIAIAVLTYRRSKNIFLGEEISLHKTAGISILSGMSVSLIFAAIVLIMSIANPNYAWKLSEMVTVAVLALVLGIIATLASFWQFYLARKFRNYLLQKLKGYKRH